MTRKAGRPEVVTSPRPSLEGGETEAAGPSPPPSLSSASLLLKSRQGKTHTLKTLASSPNLSFPVTVQFPLTNNRYRGNGGRQVPSPTTGPAAQAWKDLSRGRQLPLSLPPHPPTLQRLPLLCPLPPTAWPGWWEACATPSWQLPALATGLGTGRGKHLPGAWRTEQAP